LPDKNGYLSDSSGFGAQVGDSDIQGLMEAFRAIPSLRGQLNVALAAGGRIYYWPPGANLHAKGADVGSATCPKK
jgi:hypothetical protein